MHRLFHILCEKVRSSFHNASTKQACFSTQKDVPLRRSVIYNQRFIYSS
jgi:hypothetical protein